MRRYSQKPASDVSKKRPPKLKSEFEKNFGGHELASEASRFRKSGGVAHSRVQGRGPGGG
jgi:hypothetical protein